MYFRDTRVRDIENIDKICPICMDIITIPVTFRDLCDCSIKRRYCLNCIDVYNTIFPIMFNCVYCRATQSYSYDIDIIMLNYLDDKYGKVECPMKCNSKFLRRELVDHIENICENTNRYYCSECSKKCNKAQMIECFKEHFFKNIDINKWNNIRMRGEDTLINDPFSNMRKRCIIDCKDLMDEVIDISKHYCGICKEYIEDVNEHIEYHKLIRCDEIKTHIHHFRERKIKICMWVENLYRFEMYSGVQILDKSFKDNFNYLHGRFYNKDKVILKVSCMLNNFRKNVTLRVSENGLKILEKNVLSILKCNLDPSERVTFENILIDINTYKNHLLLIKSM